MTAAGFSFLSDGIPTWGQIVGKVGGRLLVEGLALDSGAYFLQLGQEMRRFDSRKEAKAYGTELAQDALIDNHGSAGNWHDWIKKVDDAVRAKTGMSYKDLDDYPYRDAFERRESPASVARKAIKNAGGGGF